MNVIDKHFIGKAVRNHQKDEEVWRSDEDGRHFKIETETGEIKAGFGGKLNGQKADPSKKKSQEEKVASLQRKTQMARGEYYTSGGAQRGEAIRRAVAAGRELQNAQAELERMNGVKPIKPNEAGAISGLELQNGAKGVMNGSESTAAINKGAAYIAARMQGLPAGTYFHSYTPMKGYTSTDVFSKSKDGTWMRIYMDNGEEKFSKKGLSDQEVAKLVVGNAIGMSEEQMLTRGKAPTKPAATQQKAAEKPAQTKNFAEFASRLSNEKLLEEYNNATNNAYQEKQSLLGVKEQYSSAVQKWVDEDLKHLGRPQKERLMEEVGDPNSSRGKEKLAEWAKKHHPTETHAFETRVKIRERAFQEAMEDIKTLRAEADKRNGDESASAEPVSKPASKNLFSDKVSSLERDLTDAKAEVARAQKAFQNSNGDQRKYEALQHAEYAMRRIESDLGNAKFKEKLSPKRQKEEAISDMIRARNKSERVEMVPEAAKILDDMSAGSVMTATSERGVRLDFNKNNDGTWTMTSQGRPGNRWSSKPMTAKEASAYILGADRDDTRALKFNVRKDGSQPTRKFDAGSDAVELRKLLPDASAYIDRDTQEKATEILESAPVGTYMRMRQGSRAHYYKKTDEGTWRNANSTGREDYGSGEVILALQPSAKYSGKFDIDFGGKELANGWSVTE